MLEEKEMEKMSKQLRNCENEKAILKTDQMELVEMKNWVIEINSKTGLSGH